MHEASTSPPKKHYVDINAFQFSRPRVFWESVDWIFCATAPACGGATGFWMLSGKGIVAAKVNSS
jgi:hypothetical protein